jgi:hypothetical protein
LVVAPAAHAQAPESGSAPLPKADIYLTPAEIEEIRKGSACRNLVQQFFKLQKEMGTSGLTTDFFELKILPVDELVTGQKGKYYAVYLKDATKSERFQFAGGRYVIDDFKTRFNQSLSQFVRGALAVVAAGADYELYVRGGSSSTPFSVKRELVPGHLYRKITFLPKNGEGTFANAPTPARSVPNEYKNDDLPFLRAAFLQDIVSGFFPLKQPAILESSVSTSSNAGEQYAEILLFVDW